jgi:hypothetical protein
MRKYGTASAKADTPVRNPSEEDLVSTDYFCTNRAVMKLLKTSYSIRALSAHRLINMWLKIDGICQHIEGCHRPRELRNPHCRKQ